MIRAWVGLGSNRGDPAAHLRAAVSGLAGLPQSRLVRISPVYRTAPQGRTDQPGFLNAVAELETALEPAALLEQLQALEAARGRRRDHEVRWGPRTLDLDLLVYDDRYIREPGLEVPHPRLAERAFVLVPLADLAPDLEVPGMGRVSDLRSRVDTSGIVPAELGLNVMEEDGS